MSTARHELPGAIPWGRVAAAVLALAVGLLAGFVGVSRVAGTGAQGSAVSQERYATLASTLYAEGESVAVLHDYLAALGPGDQAGFLLQLAERYSKSGDRTKMRQAEDLQRLGQALQQGGAAQTETAKDTDTKAVSQPLPSPQATAAPTAVAPAMAVVKGQGVRLRADPNTKAPALGLIRDGEKVEILNVVEGEQVQGTEKRWYKVRSGQTVGYVYYALIAPGD